MVTVALPIVALTVIVLLVKVLKWKIATLVVGGMIALAAAPPSWGQAVQDSARGGLERANAALHP